MQNNEALLSHLTKWNMEEFGRIEKTLDNPGNKHLLKLEKKKLQAELETTHNLEEFKWYQRSREVWIKSRDRNTRFYHASTTIRNHRKTIEAIKNERGEWILEPARIKAIVQNYFQAIFKEEGLGEISSSIPNGFPRLQQSHISLLVKPFAHDDVKRALFDMNPFKAPGNDGLHTGFYQGTSETVGPSVCEYAIRFFNSRTLPKDTNENLLALILKMPHPESIN